MTNDTPAPREWWIIDSLMSGRTWIAEKPLNPDHQEKAHEVHVIEKPPDKIQIGEHTILVDSEDYPFLVRYQWHVKPDKNTFYVYTNVKLGGKQTKLSMHRLVSGLTASMIDHINRNGLDNRKANLRFCSNKQNSWNRVRKNGNDFRGVYKRDGMFAAQIQVDGKKIHRYGFATAEDAARAYDELSKEYHGEFGIRNFKD